eukprot:TRINITY_DN4214_c0_g1_i2.p1 TRINITY_DN4214_c0_g1~~TRINITY_DN4214_c0_g1_i2.p1  ORF type:complete len:253 (-),score=41.85 TRINITY_DN4214_c0_g1_i2:24-782(-)
MCIRDRHEGEQQLTTDESTIIVGALDMIDKTVEDSYTPMVDVFMLDINMTLDPQKFKMLLGAGHSRVPVYEDDRQNVVGLLIIKKLISVSRKKKTALRDLKLFDIPTWTKTTPLYTVLDRFQKGRCHMAMVSETEGGQLIGIITLEDVIEELIQEEIVDETDIYVDVTARIQLANLIRNVRNSTRIRNSMSVDRRRGESMDVQRLSRFASIDFARDSDAVTHEIIARGKKKGVGGGPKMPKKKRKIILENPD